MSLYLRTLILAMAVAAGISAQNIYKVTAVFQSGVFGQAQATGINSSGQVVGWSWDGIHRCPLSVFYSGFLYSDGVLTRSVLSPATAINNSGQVVGYTGGPPSQGCLDQAYLSGVGALGKLPGYDFGAAYGINDAGQVVGLVVEPYVVTLSPSQAFLYSNGVMTGLGFLPGYNASAAYGINDSGQVVGYATDSSGHHQAFLYSGGMMAGLGVLPGYSDSVASAINDKGQVVGYVNEWYGNSQAFLYSDGVMTGLGILPGDISSQAAAINNSGQIVGFGTSSGPTFRTWAFLYSAGHMYDLNGLAALPQDTLQEATGINDSGQIVANSYSSAYLLTPLHGRFVPVTPCRIADTRTSTGPFGGPALDGQSARSFAIPQSACGIPATAQAYSLNVTAVPHGALAYLTLWPSGMARPHVSTLNSYEGNVVANAAIVPAGQDGAVSVFPWSIDPTDVILDINGYFDSTAGDSFYPVQPCRVADTRSPSSPLGGPSLSGGETRDFPVLSRPCGLPAAATTYSMNVTVVPEGYLGYLTTWATGQPQPFVSTLNSWTGKVVANAAIVPAAANGATSVYVTNPTDVILDANGYFAPPGSPGALTFYPVLPCRIADTREEDGDFGGPILAAGSTRSFPIPASGCPVPSTAAAYSLNITVVPDGPLSYLTAWPAGSPQPLVSTLNSWDGTVVANAAIVPAGSDGAISIYATNQTHVILDINGYFAP